MFALSYINPWLLTGFAGLSIPIIIHLLYKRRKRIIRFSTLQFLKIATRENARRMRLKQWILLLMRLGIIALIVFAFARPYLRNPLSGEDISGSRETILLVDVSCSMHAQNGMGAVRLDYAKELATDAINALSATDRVGVMAFSDEPIVLLKSGSDKASALNAISGLQPTYRTTNFISAIDAAQKEFDWDSELPKEIVLITDLQKSGFGDSADFRLNPAVNLTVKSISDDVENYAFAGAESSGAFYQPNRKYPLLGYLKDFSGKGFSQIDVGIKVNGSEINAQQAEVKSGASKTLATEYIFPSTGAYGIEFIGKTEDAFITDNTRYLAINVREPVKVLCVNGTPSSVPYFRETLYLEVALNPYRLGKEEGDTLFSPVIINPEELAATDFAQYPAVVITNVRELSQDVITRLEAYVRQGGGVLWFLGDEISKPRYNEFLYAKGNGVFPALLIDEHGDSADIEKFWTISNFDKEHFITEPFKDPTKGDLSIPRFYKRYDLGGLSDAESKTIMYFHDGKPALVEKLLGNGRILLMNSTADVAWSDFAKRKTYLPFIHRSLLYLTKNMSSQAENNSFLIGETVMFESDISSVQLTDSSAITLDKPESFSRTETPGIYTAKKADGSVAKSFAVNLSNIESDLSQLSPDEFKSMILGTRAYRNGDSADDDSGIRREIWTYLMIALLVLLLAEVWLGNRTPA
jgi:hypothetical protein